MCVLSMPLKEKLIEISKGFPAEFEVQQDDILNLKFTVAERKVFLSKKTLTYRAKMRVDGTSKEVKFFEMLKESSIGLSGGGFDMSPGFGFKKETFKIFGKGREGTIEEQSKLFGKDYKYSFDFSNIRKKIEKEATNAGYSFSICLNEGSV